MSALSPLCPHFMLHRCLIKHNFILQNTTSGLFFCLVILTLNEFTSLVAEKSERRLWPITSVGVNFLIHKKGLLNG